jgi:hypothetical protein
MAVDSASILIVNLFYNQLFYPTITLKHFIMEAMIQQDRVKKDITRQPLSLDNLHISDFQKEGTITAQIRQVIDTITRYPAKQVSSDRQPNIFNIEEFGFETKDYPNQENRLVFMDIPENTTEAQFKKKLKKMPTACIYRVLSNRPILTDNQVAAIKNPELNVTIDTFANSQVIRYGDNHATTPGELILDKNGKIQYRATFFWPEAKEDQDDRTVPAEDCYMSADIKAEIMSDGADATIIAEQTL